MAVCDIRPQKFPLMVSNLDRIVVVESSIRIVALCLECLNGLKKDRAAEVAAAAFHTFSPNSAPRENSMR